MTYTKKTKTRTVAKTRAKGKENKKENRMEEVQTPRQEERSLQHSCQYPGCFLFVCIILFVAFILALWISREDKPGQESQAAPYVKKQPVKVPIDTAGTKNTPQKSIKMQPPSDELLKCFEEGYEQGEEDGANDLDDGEYEASYDDNNEYTGDKDAYYREGYSHGYEDAYDEVNYLMKDENSGINEDLVE